MKAVSRRDFLRYAMGGAAVIVVGSKLGWMLKSPRYAAAATQTLNFHVTDAIKEMHTHHSTNDARCYFWIYKDATAHPDFPTGYPPECPGPIIMGAKGDTLEITVTNDLDEDHAFFIPGIGPNRQDLDSGPIAPGGTWTGSIVLGKLGAHLYYDNLNAPVNRVMGLHGAMIVMPTEADRTVDTS